MPKKGRCKSRGNGQGCAILVSRGNWQAIATVGYKDGKQIRRYKQGFATKADALAYIPVLKKEKPQTKEKLRLGEAYDKWVETVECSASTKWCYQAGFHIFDELKYVYLNDLTIDDLQECMDCTDKRVGTKRNAKICLGLIYKWAIPRGYVDDSLNLAQYIKIGKDEDTAPRRGFSIEQLEQIKKAIHSLAGANIVYCHCYLGFRPSALLQLTWDDYDPVERCFTGGIKTDAGKNRHVTVSPKIQPYIDELRERGGDYPFSLDGNQMSPKVYRNVFYNVVETLGFQKEGDHILTPHSCRHTFATLMKRVAGSEKDKLALIGHTTSAMLQHYQDVSLDDLRKITDKI